MFSDWAQSRKTPTDSPSKTHRFRDEAYANALGVDYERVKRAWEILYFEEWKSGESMVVDVIHAWNLAKKEAKNV